MVTYLYTLKDKCRCISQKTILPFQHQSKDNTAPSTEKQREVDTALAQTPLCRLQHRSTTLWLKPTTPTPRSAQIDVGETQIEKSPHCLHLSVTLVTLPQIEFSDTTIAKSTLLTEVF
ncbi:hypothetical protein HanRHA438_Chr10g0465371 [Helianthus annuus]|nr:hypothetical protein HanIR_Chr10g0487791 [Helianthus annuus]KAJ0880632.1 hypothetical protein HanRHA438_Chr10g0465371 [Helianthus annuus]